MIFSSVQALPDNIMKGSPAKANRRTRKLFINSDKWPLLTEDEKLFIISHEMGHLEQDTAKETEADAYALRRYVSKGGNAADTVLFLTRHLTEKPGHRIRAYKMLQQVKKILNDKTPTKMFSYDGEVTTAQLFGQSSQGTQIAGMSRKQARKQKRALKVQKKAAKVGVVQSRAQSKLIRTTGNAQSKMDLAKQGIASESTGTNILKSVAGIAGKLLGGGGEADTSGMFANTTPAINQQVGNDAAVYSADPSQTAAASGAGTTKKKSSNTGLIIGAVVAVVVVVAAILIFKKR